MRVLRPAGLLTVLCLASLAARAQGFHHLSFQTEKDTVVAGFHLRLAEPDHPAKPTLWQGPLTVAHGSSSCQVEASLIRDVYLSAGSKVLVVISVSGSSTSVEFFRAADCSQTWPRLKAATGGVKIEGNRLTMLPACECPAPGRPCSCTAGSVYTLSEDRPSRHLTAESNALNRRLLGRSFTGTMTVAHPRVPNSR